MFSKLDTPVIALAVCSFDASVWLYVGKARVSLNRQERVGGVCEEEMEMS